LFICFFCYIRFDCHNYPDLNLKRTIYLVVLLWCIAAQQSHAQAYTAIGGTINDYTSVTSIIAYDNNNVDSVVVVSAAAFAEGDTVMLYCVKGSIIGTGGTYPPGNPAYPAGQDAQNPRNTGRYAFMIVQEVVNPNIVVFNTSVAGFIDPMEPGEVAQLIRVPSFRYADVTSDIASPSWNPSTGTGGVVALFVHGVLRLNADIDVSGDGFKGAQGNSDDIYSAGCSSTDTMNFYENFYLDGELWAGLKGEGVTDTMFPYNRGKGSNINGGGGGNGLLAGGGGGSNFSAGVRGGKESTACTPGVSVTGGAGGFDLGRNGWYYINNNADRSDRIFFGGGGGSGTRIAGATTTNGGNGGGIVVIVADTIVGNGHTIRADGGDVLALAINGAGGGGGAGGCIILDVAGYQSTLNLSAIGGDGGNTWGLPGADTTGMGGAGGGGIYWMAGSTHPGVATSFSTGTNGRFLSTIPYNPLESASPPFKRNDLVAPLRGFLFNPVPSHFTVCSDVDPDPIIASEPKGGDGSGSYTYQWIDSSKTQNFWDIAPGFSTGKDYDPGILSDTTYYRRVVTSGLLPPDTSFRIAVYVHPAITGNTIAANDTVCSGNAPQLFVSSATIGGGPTGGTYNYKWQHLPDGAGNYTDITTVSLEPTYQEGGLVTSTDYRRIAYSGVCIDTSNEERVRVLETLTGNNITPFDTICINTIPDLISGPLPSNGDQADIRYQWLTSTSPAAMGTVIPGETAISYQSPALSQTTYIRRIVLSGNDDACRDTSLYVEILNIPAITNNSITASQTVCQEDQPDLLSGTSPGGGYLSQYTYTWISSTDQSNWAPASGGGPNNVLTSFDPGVMSGDTTWFRRVVGSGGAQLACKDTSSSVVINVLPSITNNLLTPADDLKCQREMPEIINGSLPGGGATVSGVDPTRVYSWEVAQVEGVPGSPNWFHPTTGAAAQNFTDPNQLSTDIDRWYRRIVTSGPAGQCVSISDTVHLVVHSEITGNAIDPTQAICFDDTRALRNTAMTGGETGITPVFTWRGWLEGETPDDAVPIAGSDQLQYQSGPYTDPATLIYFYDRVVQIGACRDTSNAMQVTVMQLPGGELTDAGFNACEKDTSLQVDLNMSSLTAGHYVTPWYVYLEDGVHAGIGPGSFSQDMDTMGIVMDTEEADHRTYTYEIESVIYYPEGDTYGCISPPGNLPSTPVVVELYRKPDPQILVDGAARDSFKVCNTTALLEFVPDNGTLTRWSEPAGSVFFSPGTGQDEFNVSIPNNHNDFGEYRIYIMSQAGDCSGLDSIDLHFFEQPAPAYAGRDTMLFLINSVQLRADPPTAGIGTWTLTGGKGNIEDINDPHTFVYDLGMGQENDFTWTIRNGEDEGTCITTDHVTTVLRNDVLRYQGFSPNNDMSNEYFIMQGLIYADEFTIRFLNALGQTVRTITQDNIGEMEVDESLITRGLRADEMVVWDGLSDNGNPVPDGTYYYVVTFVMYQRDYLTGEKTGEVHYDLKDYVVVARE
jgi:hypothetical protein